MKYTTLGNAAIDHTWSINFPFEITIMAATINQKQVTSLYMIHQKCDNRKNLTQKCR